MEDYIEQELNLTAKKPNSKLMRVDRQQNYWEIQQKSLNLISLTELTTKYLDEKLKISEVRRSKVSESKRYGDIETLNVKYMKLWRFHTDILFKLPQRSLFRTTFQSNWSIRNNRQFSTQLSESTFYKTQKIVSGWQNLQWFVC